MTAFHVSPTVLVSSVAMTAPAFDRVSENVACPVPPGAAPGDTSVPFDTLKASSVVVGDRAVLNRSPLTAATTFIEVVCDVETKADVV